MNSIDQLAAAGARFSTTLDAAKARINEPSLEWYPYQSLTNLHTLDQLLTGEHREIFSQIAGQRLLDIGCADGELSFFFESLGFPVDAFDHPIPNYNAMRGVRALHEELGSRVEIHSVDLDALFDLPSRQYGMVLLLGVIYHLKNPFHLLEKLSKRARYCLISTALTEVVPGIDGAVSGAPLAYLADAWELNGDSTNYWICSEAGFRRLLKRSNWEICDYKVWSGEGRIAGQRAFCLARSCFSDRVNVLYGPGWHAVEPGGWRWTERRFSVRLESSVAASSNRLRMRIYVPEAVLADGVALTMRAFANGVELPVHRFAQPGEYEYAPELAGFETGREDIRVDFCLDRALVPDAADNRERGIVVAEIGA